MFDCKRAFWCIPLASQQGVQTVLYLPISCTCRQNCMWSRQKKTFMSHISFRSSIKNTKTNISHNIIYIYTQYIQISFPIISSLDHPRPTISLCLPNAVSKMAYYGFPALGKMFSHFKCVLYISTRVLRLSAISKELASSADTGTGRWEWLRLRLKQDETNGDVKSCT